jgi:hypothetical protein
LNRYSYCLNNPLKYIDPSGHRIDDKPNFAPPTDGGGGSGGEGDGNRQDDGDENERQSLPLEPKGTLPTNAETITIPVPPIPVVVGESIGSTILGWLAVAGTFVLMVLFQQIHLEIIQHFLRRLANQPKKMDSNLRKTGTVKR